MTAAFTGQPAHSPGVHDLHYYHTRCIRSSCPGLDVDGNARGVSCLGERARVSKNG
jgi:hypothetical protein